MDNDLRDRIREALTGHDADYIEVRVDQTSSSHLRYRGKDLEEAGRSTGQGGCVRAIAGGGWGFASFNRLDDLKGQVAAAVRFARAVGGERIKLVPIQAVVDAVPPTIGKDPRPVPLAEKKRIMDEYVDLVMTTEGVSSLSLGYADTNRRVVLATSDGTYIEQERADVAFYLAAMARDGGEVQQSTLSLGWLGDFAPVEHLHEAVRQAAQKAVVLLRAPQAQGGPRTVVLDPVLAGVFIHEAFGHLSEADHVYENPQLRDLMRLGKRFGGKHLNVVDGAAVPNLRGSFKYDDEGVPAKKTYLLREGELVGRLHSRETAAAMGEAPTGNARAISTMFPPIVRMTNTYIEPGGATFQEVIGDVKDGVYVKSWYGGMTSMEQFTFSAGEAYAIRNGRIEEALRPVMLTGNLFVTLQNLDAIANDLDFNQGGGCGKQGQVPLAVSNGSPHIRIQQCVISGSGR